MRTFIFWLILSKLLAAEVVQAQTTDTLRVDVDLVTVGVKVTDSKGQDATGLTERDFRVFADGKQQQIATFAAEQQPVSVLILLEGSYSMIRNRRLDEAKLALRQLVEHRHPDSEYSLMTFDDEAELLVDFVTDWQPIQTALDKLNPRGDGSGLYDSMSVALDHFERAKYPRQALVFITDGADQNSRLNLEDVIGRVQDSWSQIYVVGFFDPKEDEVFRSSDRTVTLVSGREIDNPRYAFKRLAEQSGAAQYFPATGQELETAVGEIALDLKTQYTLGYYTSAVSGDGSYRRIEVNVRPRGLIVRTRHGFSLSDADEDAAPNRNPNIPSAAETISKRLFPYEIKTTRRGDDVIYREDFSDAASGWPQKPGFYLQSGKYHLESQRSTSSNDGLVAANGPVWTDFKASVVVEFARFNRRVGSASPAAGLVFRLSDRGYYALLISPSGASSTHYKLVRQDFDSPAALDLIPWRESVRPASYGAAPHRLEVVCTGDLIQLFINGVQVGEFRDGSFAEGLVGTVLFGDGHAVFDDLVAGPMN